MKSKMQLTGTFRDFLVFLLLSFMLLFVLLPLSSAEGQEAEGSPTLTATSAATIEFSGQITTISVDQLVVNNLIVIIDVPNLTFVPQIGKVVYIQGVLQPDGTILAIIVSDQPIITSPTPTPTGTVTTTWVATPTATLTPEGSITPEVPPTITPSVDMGLGPIIIIEGPVEAININIITIYSINIVVSEDDPILTTIQIGDFIRVEGELVNVDDDNQDDDAFDVLLIDSDVSITVVIIAINITYVDVDIFVNEGEIWRDDDDDDSCANPPPPWAPAHGWRRRCEGR